MGDILVICQRVTRNFPAEENREFKSQDQGNIWAEQAFMEA